MNTTSSLGTLPGFPPLPDINHPKYCLPPSISTNIQVETALVNLHKAIASHSPQFPRLLEEFTSLAPSPISVSSSLASSSDQIIKIHRNNSASSQSDSISTITPSQWLGQDVNTIAFEHFGSLTLLSHACVVSNLPAMKLLVQQPRIDLEYPLHETWLSPLNLVCTLPLTQTTLEMVTVLLDAGAAWTSHDANHRTPLFNMFACAFDHEEPYNQLHIDALKVFMSHGADWLPLSIVFSDYHQKHSEIYLQIVEIIITDRLFVEKECNHQNIYESFLSLFRNPSLTPELLKAIIPLNPELFRRFATQLHDYNTGLRLLGRSQHRQQEMALLIASGTFNTELIQPHSVLIQHTPLSYLLRYSTPISDKTLEIIQILTNAADYFPIEAKHQWLRRRRVKYITARVYKEDLMSLKERFETEIETHGLSNSNLLEASSKAQLDTAIADLTQQLVQHESMEHSFSEQREQFGDFFDLCRDCPYCIKQRKEIQQDSTPSIGTIFNGQITSNKDLVGHPQLDDKLKSSGKGKSTSPETIFSRFVCAGCDHCESKWEVSNADTMQDDYPELVCLIHESEWDSRHISLPLQNLLIYNSLQPDIKALQKLIDFMFQKVLHLNVKNLIRKHASSLVSTILTSSTPNFDILHYLITAKGGLLPPLQVPVLKMSSTTSNQQPAALFGELPQGPPGAPVPPGGGGGGGGGAVHGQPGLFIQLNGDGEEIPVALEDLVVEYEYNTNPIMTVLAHYSGIVHNPHVLLVDVQQAQVKMLLQGWKISQADFDKMLTKAMEQSAQLIKTACPQSPINITKLNPTSQQTLAHSLPLGCLLPPPEWHLVRIVSFLLTNQTTLATIPNPIPTIFQNAKLSSVPVAQLPAYILSGLAGPLPAPKTNQDLHKEDWAVEGMSQVYKRQHNRIKLGFFSKLFASKDKLQAELAKLLPDKYPNTFGIEDDEDQLHRLMSFDPATNVSISEFIALAQRKGGKFSPPTCATCGGVYDFNFHIQRSQQRQNKYLSTLGLSVDEVSQKLLTEDEAFDELVKNQVEFDPRKDHQNTLTLESSANSNACSTSRCHSSSLNNSRPIDQCTKCGSCNWIFAPDEDDYSIGDEFKTKKQLSEKLCPNHDPLAHDDDSTTVPSPHGPPIQQFSKQLLHNHQKAVTDKVLEAQIQNRFNLVLLLMKKTTMSPISIYTLLDILAKNTDYTQIVTNIYHSPIEIDPNIANIAISVCHSTYTTHSSLNPNTFIVQKLSANPKLVPINPYQWLRHGNTVTQLTSSLHSTSTDIDELGGDGGNTPVDDGMNDLPSISSMSRQGQTMTAATRTNLFSGTGLGGMTSKSGLMMMSSGPNLDGGQQQQHHNQQQQSSNLRSMGSSLTAKPYVPTMEAIPYETDCVDQDKQPRSRCNSSRDKNSPHQQQKDDFTESSIKKPKEIYEIDWIHNIQVNSTTDSQNKSKFHQQLSQKKQKIGPNSALNNRLVLISLCLPQTMAFFSQEFSRHVFTVYGNPQQPDQCTPLYHEHNLSYPEQQLYLHVSIRVLTIFKWCQLNKGHSGKEDIHVIAGKKPIVTEMGTVLDFFCADQCEALYLSTRSNLLRSFPELKPFEQLGWGPDQFCGDSLTPTIPTTTRSGSTSHPSDRTTHSTEVSVNTSSSEPSTHSPSITATTASQPPVHSQLFVSGADPQRFILEYLSSEATRESNVGIIQGMHHLRNFLRRSKISTPLINESNNLQNQFFAWLLFSPYSFASPFGISLLKYWLTHLMRSLRYSSINFTIFTRVLYIWLKQTPTIYSSFKIQLLRLVHDNAIASQSYWTQPNMQVFENGGESLQLGTILQQNGHFAFSSTPTSSILAQPGTPRAYGDKSDGPFVTIVPNGSVAGSHLDLGSNRISDGRVHSNNLPALQPQHFIHPSATSNIPAPFTAPHFLLQSSHINLQPDHHLLQTAQSLTLTTKPLLSTHSSVGASLHTASTRRLSIVEQHVIDRKFNQVSQIQRPVSKYYSFSMIPTMLSLVNRDHGKLATVAQNERKQYWYELKMATFLRKSITKLRAKYFASLHQTVHLRTNANHPLSGHECTNQIDKITQRLTNNGHFTPGMGYLVTHLSKGAYGLDNNCHDFGQTSAGFVPKGAPPMAQNAGMNTDKNTKGQDDVVISPAVLAQLEQSQFDVLGLHLGLQQIRGLAQTRYYHTLRSHSERRYTNAELKYRRDMFPTPLQLDYQLHYTHKPAMIQKINLESRMHSKEIDQEIKDMGAENVEAEPGDELLQLPHQDRNDGGALFSPQHNKPHNNPKQVVHTFVPTAPDGSSLSAVSLPATQFSLPVITLPPILKPLVPFVYRTNTIPALLMTEQGYNPFKYTRQRRNFFDSFSAEYFSLLILNSGTVLCTLPKNMIAVVPQPDDQELENNEERQMMKQVNDRGMALVGKERGSQNDTFKMALDQLPAAQPLMYQHDNDDEYDGDIHNDLKHREKHQVHFADPDDLHDNSTDGSTPATTQYGADGNRSPRPHNYDSDHDDDDDDDDSHDDGSFHSHSDSVYRVSPSIGADGDYHKSVIPRSSQFHQGLGAKAKGSGTETLYLSKLICEGHFQSISAQFVDIISLFLFNPYIHETLSHWFDSSLLSGFLAVCSEFNQYTVQIVDLLLTFPDRFLLLDQQCASYYWLTDDSLQAHAIKALRDFSQHSGLDFAKKLDNFGSNMLHPPGFLRHPDDFVPLGHHLGQLNASHHSGNHSVDNFNNLMASAQISSAFPPAIATTSIATEPVKDNNISLTASLTSAHHNVYQFPTSDLKPISPQHHQQKQQHQQHQSASNVNHQYTTSIGQFYQFTQYGPVYTPHQHHLLQPHQLAHLCKQEEILKDQIDWLSDHINDERGCFKTDTQQQKAFFENLYSGQLPSPGNYYSKDTSVGSPTGSNGFDSFPDHQYNNGYNPETDEYTISAVTVKHPYFQHTTNPSPSNHTGSTVFTTPTIATAESQFLLKYQQQHLLLNKTVQLNGYYSVSSSLQRALGSNSSTQYSSIFAPNPDLQSHQSSQQQAPLSLHQKKLLAMRGLLTFISRKDVSHTIFHVQIMTKLLNYIINIDEQIHASECNNFSGDPGYTPSTPLPGQSNPIFTTAKSIDSSHQQNDDNNNNKGDSYILFNLETNTTIATKSNDTGLSGTTLQHASSSIAAPSSDITRSGLNQGPTTSTAPVALKRQTLSHSSLQTLAEGQPEDLNSSNQGQVVRVTSPGQHNRTQSQSRKTSIVLGAPTNGQNGTQTRLSQRQNRSAYTFTFSTTKHQEEYEKKQHYLHKIEVSVRRELSTITVPYLLAQLFTTSAPLNTFSVLLTQILIKYQYYYDYVPQRAEQWKNHLKFGYNQNRDYLRLFNHPFVILCHNRAQSIASSAHRYIIQLILFPHKAFAVNCPQQQPEEYLKYDPTASNSQLQTLAHLTSILSPSSICDITNVSSFAVPRPNITVKMLSRRYDIKLPQFNKIWAFGYGDVGLRPVAHLLGLKNSSHHDGLSLAPSFDRNTGLTIPLIHAGMPGSQSNSNTHASVAELSVDISNSDSNSAHAHTNLNTNSTSTLAQIYNHHEIFAKTLRFRFPWLTTRVVMPDSEAIAQLEETMLDPELTDQTHQQQANGMHNSNPVVEYNNTATGNGGVSGGNVGIAPKHQPKPPKNTVWLEKDEEKKIQRGRILVEDQNLVPGHKVPAVVTEAGNITDSDKSGLNSESPTSPALQHQQHITFTLKKTQKGDRIVVLEDLDIIYIIKNNRKQIEKEKRSKVLRDTSFWRVITLDFVHGFFQFLRSRTGRAVDPDTVRKYLQDPTAVLERLQKQLESALVHQDPQDIENALALGSPSGVNGDQNSKCDGIVLFPSLNSTNELSSPAAVTAESLLENTYLRDRKLKERPIPAHVYEFLCILVEFQAVESRYSQPPKGNRLISALPSASSPSAQL